LGTIRHPIHLLGRNINDQSSSHITHSHWLCRIKYVYRNTIGESLSNITLRQKTKAWDSSRVSASIPSGVGFLGAGLIVKSSEKDPITGESHHLVQGITTAAATWYVVIYVL
jgi:hypothetical protein